MALVLACACSSLPPVPSQGGPQWREFTSEHFVLHTDLAADKASSLSRELERLLHAYLQLGWKAKGEIPIKFNVVVFADPDEYHEYAARNVLGFYVSNLMYEPWVVMGYASNQYELDVLKHELNHAIAYQAIQNQPRWFAEGIANYFETAHFSSNEWFVVGMPAERRLAILQRFGLLHPAAIMGATDDQSPLFEERFYATSWLLVHYLMTEHSDAFGRFQEALARGEHAVDAWAAAFPDLSHERLHQLLTGYFVRGDYVAYTLRVKAAPAVTRERMMSDADVYALRALLHSGCRSCGERGKDQAREEYAAALRADPHHVRAGLMRVADMPSDAGRMKAARELVVAHPQSWYAWLALALAEIQAGRAASEEARTAAERIGALAPRQPYALMLLAAHAAATDREDEAFELSRRAVRLQPTNAQLLILRYGLLMALGRCEELPALLLTLANVTHSPPREMQRAAEKCVPRPSGIAAEN